MMSRSPAPLRLFSSLLFTLFAAGTGPARAALQLRTSSAILPRVRREELHDFLATPSHWPEIVLSSHSVKPPSSGDNRVDVPLQVGERVEEVFGLPPFLPLSVTWRCVESDPAGGKLEFFSEDGVPGLADRCRMKFDVEEVPGGRGCRVDLTMEFEPRSPLVPLAVPFLGADNGLALKAFLPAVVEKRFGNR